MPNLEDVLFALKNNFYHIKRRKGEEEQKEVSNFVEIIFASKIVYHHIREEKVKICNGDRFKNVKIEGYRFRAKISTRRNIEKREEKALKCNSIIFAPNMVFLPD